MKVKPTFILLRIFLLYVDLVAICLLYSLSSDGFVRVTKEFVAKNCLIRIRPATKIENIKKQSEMSAHSNAVSASKTSLEILTPVS